MSVDITTKSTWELVLDRIKAKRCQMADMGDTPTPRYDLMVKVLESVYFNRTDRGTVVEALARRPLTEAEWALRRMLTCVIWNLESLNAKQPTLRHSMLVDSAITLALEISGEVLAERENSQ